jgi:hypothetical protein
MSAFASICSRLVAAASGSGSSTSGATTQHYISEDKAEEAYIDGDLEPPKELHLPLRPAEHGYHPNPYTRDAQLGFELLDDALGPHQPWEGESCIE